MKKKKTFKQLVKEYRTGTLLVLPFLILYLVFVMGPIVISAGMSLTDYNLLETPNFVGFDNYKVLFLEDDVFITAIKNTLIFAVIAGPIGLFMSFILAYIINGKPFSKFFSLLFYAPALTSGIAMTVVWMYFFSSDRYGFINNILFQLGIINEPLLWNIDGKYILTVVIIISVWMNMGSGFLVFFAGLKNTSKELMEAGKIDGIRNSTQELYYIIIPQMKPQLLFGCINSVTTSLGVFEIAMGVAGFPSPNYAGHTIVAHLYDYAFVRFQMGYAAAVAMVLFLVTFVLGKILTKVLSSNDA